MISCTNLIIPLQTLTWWIGHKTSIVVVAVEQEVAAFGDCDGDFCVDSYSFVGVGVVAALVARAFYLHRFWAASHEAYPSRTALTWYCTAFYKRGMKWIN